MAPKASSKGKDETAQMFWFPEPTEGYALGEILLEDTQQNMQVKLHLQDGTNKVRASLAASRASDARASAVTLRAALALPLPACRRPETAPSPGTDDHRTLVAEEGGQPEGARRRRR